MDVVRSTYGILSQFGGAPVPSSVSSRQSKTADIAFPDPVLFDRNGDNRLDALDVVYTSSAKLQRFSEVAKHASDARAALPEPAAEVKRPLPAAYAGEKEEADVKPEPTAALKPRVSLTV